MASCCRCRCTCCGARCHVNAFGARGNRTHGAAARGEGVIDGCLVLLEDRVERYAIVAIGNNLGKVLVDRIILRASRHGECMTCGIGVERARASNIPRANRGPTQEGVGTLVVDIMVGHRQGHTIADLLLQIGRTRARYARDVGALIAEVNLLPGLLPQCGELIRGVAEGRHVVAGILYEYIIHIVAGVLARNASTIDPAPADELPARIRSRVARVAARVGILERRGIGVTITMGKAWQVPSLLQVLIHGTCVGNGAARHVAIDLGEGTISAWQVGNGDQFAEAAHEYRVGVDREGAVDLRILFRANQRTRILVAARAACVNVPTDEVILL